MCHEFWTSFTKKHMCFKWNWMIPIRTSRIRQNDADPTQIGSGSEYTTLALRHNFCAHFLLSQGRGIVPALWLRPSLLSRLVQGCGPTIFTISQFSFSISIFPSNKYHFSYNFQNKIITEIESVRFFYWQTFLGFKKLYLQFMICFCCSQSNRRNLSFIAFLKICLKPYREAVDVFLKENPHLERWQVADPEREVKQGLVLPFQLSASLVLHVWSCLAWDRKYMLGTKTRKWNGKNYSLSKKKNLITQFLAMLSYSQFIELRLLQRFSCFITER